MILFIFMLSILTEPLLSNINFNIISFSIYPSILSIIILYPYLKLYKLIMADRRRENIKIQILKHTIFSIFIFIILIISSFVEAYISGGLTTMLIKYC